MKVNKKIPLKCKAFFDSGIKEISTPIPQANELLVEVVAFGINRADIEQAKGMYPPPPRAPASLGLELSGIVRSKGRSVKGFKIGDKVMGLVPGGAYSEFAALPEETAFKIPQILKLDEAAALPEALFTVWSNIFMIARARSKERILIQGGSGGVGIHAIQICKRLGLEVFTTASSEKKTRVCLGNGASKVFNYSEAGYPQNLVDSLTDGIDVVFDLVGVKYFETHLKILRYGGRLVLIDSTSGDLGEIDIGPLLTKNIYLTGSLLRPRSPREKAEMAKGIKLKIMPHIRSGKIKPVIGAVFRGLESVTKAHQAYESRENVGKVIVVLQEFRHD